MKDFMHCIAQLKSSNVPLDTNIMAIVFEHSIASEARLLRVCNAYKDALPCFEKTLQLCGNDKQRARLAEVNRLLLFICAPFSLQRQKTLLRVGKCIGKVLKMPVQQDCPLRERKYGYKLDLCRRNCQEKDLVCKRRIRMSELAACSVIAIQHHCGGEAEGFYTSMQSAIIDEEFPIQCKYKELSFPKMLNSDAETTKDYVKDLKMEDIPILVPKNGKFVPNPVFAQKALEILQFERKALHSRPSKDSREIDDKFRIKAIRSRNFNDGLFKPVKFDESKLKRPNTESNKPVKIQIFSDNVVKTFGSLERLNKTNVEAPTQGFLPIFLQGARPIPDASMTFISTQNFDLNQNAYSRTTPMFKHYDSVPTNPPTTNYPLFKTTTPTTSKWIPWYYETVLLTSPFYQAMTSAPMPMNFHENTNFNPINMEAMESRLAQQLSRSNKFNQANLPRVPISNQVQSQIPFQDFAAPTPTPAFMNLWPTSPLFQLPKQSQNYHAATSSSKFGGEHPNLFNLTNIKELADSYISGAIQAFGSQHGEMSSMFASTIANHSGNGALSRLISTIERVSPKIIENIRSKLDSLGVSK